MTANLTMTIYLVPATTVLFSVLAFLDLSLQQLTLSHWTCNLQIYVKFFGSISRQTNPTKDIEMHTQKGTQTNMLSSALRSFKYLF